MKKGLGKIADYVVTDKGRFDTHFVKRRFTLQFAYPPRVRLVNRCNAPQRDFQSKQNENSGQVM